MGCTNADWGGKHWIRDEKRTAIYIRDGFQCAYCGRSLKDAGPAEVALDHLLPRSTGGDNSATNLITSCRTCNSARGNRPWVDYCSQGAQDRINQLRNQPLNIPLARAILSGEISELVADIEVLR